MNKREELRVKILEKVNVAKEAPTKKSLAQSCGETRIYRKGSHGEQHRLSDIFAAVIDDMVSKGEVVLDDRPIYNAPRVRLPDRPAKPLFQDHQGPPVVTWRDPSVIDPAIARAKPTTQPKEKEAEIVDIKLPPSLLPVAVAKAEVAAVDKVAPMSAAAKAIAQPVAVTRVKVPKKKPNQRAIEAWASLIEAGKPFSRTTWCHLAHISSGAIGRWVVVHDAVDVAIRCMTAADWQGMDQWLDVVADSIVKSELPPVPTPSNDGTIADLERRLAVLQAENAELKARSPEPAAILPSPIEVLVGKVRDLDVVLNKRNSEALAHAAETQQLENERTALLTAIGVLQKESK
ncbi:hypothetical protein H6F75_00445 [Nodosilinea sp. FACHB-131]|uniref:hypothetical protein n=1 Tax=Cyanophyceae TaxID=3028117 RepID=UPI001686817B|nr:hypothetical protein [Nodosilinea sp. FACHB-131]MBD1871939.1 hypothetical protein [Nodosilinea sp. FACHB-131]